MRPANGRQAAATAAQILSVLSFIWFLSLTAFGGGAVRVLGILITSNNRWRPFEIGAVFLALHLFLTRNVPAGQPPVTSRLSHLRGWARLAAPIGLAIAFSWLTASYSARSVGGSDSYGYASQAELWSHGRLAVRQPIVDLVPWPDAGPTFTPLGYTPSPGAEDVLVPTYSPGLPMLMALARIIAGSCAIFNVVPICAGILILSSYGIGKGLGGHHVGLASAWLVATSPVVLFVSLSPMSDVPAAAAWATSFWLLQSEAVATDLCAGLAISVAILVRPNLAPLAIFPLAWRLLNVSKATPQTRRREWVRVCALGAGIAPGVIVVALLNWHLYGSPLQSGYGDLTGLFSGHYFASNVRRYTGWLVTTQTVLPLLGWPILLIASRRVWPAVRDTSYVLLLGLFSISVWVLYCLYSEFDAWWYLRFLVPSWPMIMGATAQLLFLPSRHVGRVGAAVALLICLAIGARGIRLSKEQVLLDFGRGEQKFSTAATMVGEYTEPDSVIFSLLHSGSVRYYAARQTLRFDFLDAAWLDRAVTWLRNHGMHAYLLAEDEEVGRFRERFASSRTVSTVQADPFVVYLGSSRVRLFDLWGRSGPPILVKDPRNPERCVPPARVKTP